ncbi:hypothetical protein Leryth_003359 [Lithospermum erythrorhizon]|nr:hypothetical protein Leryth_003359 [Lithospermum erythrorhizon]
MKEINSPLPLHAEQGKILELEKSLSIEMIPSTDANLATLTYIIWREAGSLEGLCEGSFAVSWEIGEGRRLPYPSPPPKAIYALFSLQRAYTENR